MSMHEKHHQFSPSRLKHLSLCPGAFILEEGIEDTSSPAAAEGTAMHRAVELGEILSEFNEEQRSMIQKCIDYPACLAPPETLKNGKHETKISVIDEDFNVLTEGTMDYILDLGDNVLAIDWKFGRGFVGDPATNKQVRAYSAGVMQKYMKPVEFHIAQPRLNYFKGVRFELDALPAMIAEISAVRDACLDESRLILQPSDDACRFCKAKNQCPAYSKSNLTLDENNPLAQIEHTTELSSEKLGEYLYQWRSLKKVGQNLEHAAKIKLLKGDVIDGVELGSRKGSMKINDANGFFKALSGVLSIDEFMSFIDVKITPLIDAYAKKRRETVKTTLKEAKEELMTIALNFGERASDSKTLKYTKKEDAENGTTS